MFPIVIHGMPIGWSLYLTLRDGPRSAGHQSRSPKLRRLEASRTMKSSWSAPNSEGFCRGAQGTQMPDDSVHATRYNNASIYITIYITIYIYNYIYILYIYIYFAVCAVLRLCCIFRMSTFPDLWRRGPRNLAPPSWIVLFQVCRQPHGRDNRTNVMGCALMRALSAKELFVFYPQSFCSFTLIHQNTQVTALLGEGIPGILGGVQKGPVRSVGRFVMFVGSGCETTHGETCENGIRTSL